LAPSQVTLWKNGFPNGQDFGHGAPAGVAGPESANNAGAQTSFIPLLTLGLPPNAVMALMVGAMTIQGIVPGPQVIERNPELFWGLVASMWIGNLMLVIKPATDLPLGEAFACADRLLFPAIVCFYCIGLYSISNDSAQVMMAAFFGFVGYALYKLEFEPAPLALGFVLGRLLEETLRQALIISDGNPLTFLQSPLSATLLVVAAFALVVAVLPKMRKSREDVFKEA